ncbi:hypothetical protein [Spirosoma gilvum]
MKTFLLLLLSTSILGLSASCTQRKTTNRTMDEVLIDYVQAMQTNDTAMLADCFHSTVFPLFKTTRQEFANQIFTVTKKMGFDVYVERLPYQSIKREFTFDKIDYKTLGMVWKVNYHANTANKDQLETMKGMTEYYRSLYKDLQESYQAVYHIPGDVEMISLNEKTGDLSVLQPENITFIYEKSKQEWRLVPSTYSFLRMANLGSSDKLKTVKKQ